MKNDKQNNEVKPVKLPPGKCSALYCGDCTYFNPLKTSYGKCWCGYYKSYSRKSSDIACNHYHR